MASIGYRLPGTRIEEINQTVSPNPASTQRKPCFIGKASSKIKVEYEQVIRSSTGLADALEYSSEGIDEIIEVGSQRGLTDFTEGTDFNLSGDEIVWTSSGVVTAGATYFVTYKYDRPSSDYVYKEFSKYEDVLNDLGDDIPANDLVMISKLALKYYGVPTIGIVQVPESATISDYISALSAIKFRDVQTIGILNSAVAIQSAAASHATERSLSDNMRYRIFYTGAAVGTDLGDNDDPSSIRGLANSFKNERVVFVNAPRAKYYYTDPDTKEEKTTVVNGAFIGAAVGAYKDSFQDPTATLLNRNLPGLELYTEDYEDYYSDEKLTQAGSSSCLVMKPVSGLIQFIDDINTDNRSVERNNINIITTKDYIANDVRTQINRTFIGSLIKNRPHYKNVIYTYLKNLFKIYLSNSLIEQIGDLNVNLPSDRRDTIEIFYSYYAIYTHKYTDGKFSIVV